MTNNYLKFAGIAIVAGLLVVAGYWVKKPTMITEHVDGTKTTISGSVSSPDIMSPYFSYGGVRKWGASKTNLNTASTTLCSILSPVSTSTLTLASLQITSGTTSQTVFEIGKIVGSNAATTSRLAYSNLVSAGQMSLVTGYAATSTNGDLAATGSSTNPYILGPNTYVNFKYGGHLGALNVFAGSCKAEFTEL